MEAPRKTRRLATLFLALTLTLSGSPPLDAQPPLRQALRAQTDRAGLEEALQTGAVLEHPYSQAMDRRMDRVKRLARRISASFHPSDLDLLEKPSQIDTTSVLWETDEGDLREVQVNRIKDTVIPNRRPAKGGIRAILRLVTLGVAFPQLWERFLEEDPSLKEAEDFLKMLSVQLGRALARGMSWKLALVNLTEHLGGGKGDVLGLAAVLDEEGVPQAAPFKNEYSQQEKDRLAFEVGLALAKNGWVGPDLDVPAPDVDTDSRWMALMTEAYLQVQLKDNNSSLRRNHPVLIRRLLPLQEEDPMDLPLLKATVAYVGETGRPVRELAAYTGKPVDLGGSLGRSDATGMGGLIVAEELVRKLPQLFGHRGGSNEPLKDLSVAVHGFGNAGEASARLFTQAGAKVVAVSDTSGYLYKGSGFTPGDLRRLASFKREGNAFRNYSSLKLPGVQFAPNHLQLLELKVDILVPAASELVITEENASRIQAKLVIPEANGAVTPEADEVLAKKGTVVAPDTLASAGGVIVSWFEMLQNFEGRQWFLEEVQRKLKEHLTQSTVQLLEGWRQLKKEAGSSLTLMTAADFLSVERLVKHFGRSGKPQGDGGGRDVSDFLWDESEKGSSPPFTLPRWIGTDRLLRRVGSVQPASDYPVGVARNLQDSVLTKPPLQKYYGTEAPLVYLPEVTKRVAQKVGRQVPVYLWREPTVLPTGSTKPRMLAVLFNHFLHTEDPWPKVIATRSTGNHGLALAWFGNFLRELKEQDPDRWSFQPPQIAVYTSRDVPEQKKRAMKRLGADLHDSFTDYADAWRGIKSQLYEDGFLYWPHGSGAIVFGNMTSAVQLTRQIEKHPVLGESRIALFSAAGVGGRVAGLSAGLTQLLPGRVKVIAAETDRVDPVFKALEAGRPVEISVPEGEIVEDGIAVDQMEYTAFRLFHDTGEAVVRVPWQKGLRESRLLIRQLKEIRRSGEDVGPAITEGVTGVSLVALLENPELVRGMDAVIIDETGINLAPHLKRRIQRAASYSGAAAGLEEIIRQTWDPYPNLRQPGLFNGRGTVYLSFSLSDAHPESFGVALGDLQGLATNSMEGLAPEIQEKVRQYMQPRLQARVGVSRWQNGAIALVETLTPESVEISDVYDGPSFRAKIEFPLQRLERGGYHYAVELSMDGGKTWTKGEGGYFFLNHPSASGDGGGVADPNSAQRFQEAFQELGRMEDLTPIEQPKALADFLHRLGEWGKDPGVLRAFGESDERDLFVHRLQELILPLADRSQGLIRLSPQPARKPAAASSLFDQEVDEESLEDPHLKVLAVGLNPVSETLVNLGASNGSATATVTKQPGGFAAHLSRAAKAAGTLVKVIVLKGNGEEKASDKTVADLLGNEGLGVTPIPWDGSDRPSVIFRTESGGEFRLTARSPLSGHEPSMKKFREAQIQAVEGVVEALQSAPKVATLSRGEAPFVLAVGEQVTEPKLANQMKQLILEAREKKGRVYFAASRELKPEILQELLSAGPDAVHFYSPEQIPDAGSPGETAASARRLLGQYSQLTEILISMPPLYEMREGTLHQVESMVVASRQGAWQAKILIEPDRERGESFHRIGEEDVAVANYLTVRESYQEEAETDINRLLQRAAARALRARLAYRGLRNGKEEDFNRMPTSADVQDVSYQVEWIPLPVETGLEERLSGLMEARQGHGVLVVPGRALRQFAGLEELLSGLPPSLASAVVLTGEGPGVERLQRANPQLHIFPGEEPIDLAVYLSGLEEIDRVSVLEDSTLAAGLEELMASFQIPVKTIPWNLTFFFEALGVPSATSQRVGLEELAGDLFTRRGA